MKFTPEKRNQGHECLSGCQKDYDCPCLSTHEMQECTMDLECKCEDCTKENVKMD